MLEGKHPDSKYIYAMHLYNLLIGVESINISQKVVVFISFVLSLRPQTMHVNNWHLSHESFEILQYTLKKQSNPPLFGVFIHISQHTLGLRIDINIMYV